jgi:hypothetical protein
MSLGAYWIVVAIALAIIGAAVAVIRDWLTDRAERRRRQRRNDPEPPRVPSPCQRE